MRYRAAARPNVSINSAGPASFSEERELNRQKVAELIDGDRLTGKMSEKRTDSMHAVEKDSSGARATGRLPRDDDWPAVTRLECVFHILCPGILCT